MEVTVVLWIRKYFFRFRIEPQSWLTDPDPDPGGQLITDPAGSGSYMDIFVPNEKKCCKIGRKSW
jgi:hypothetical protein